MSPAAPALVAAVDIRAGGRPLDPSIVERLLEARVQDNLMLPDAFVLRLRDPDFQLVDGTLFDPGVKVELRFASDEATAAGGAPADPFQGEVATIAPQFESEGCVLVVRGYDVSHRLHRSRNTRTFQDMTASDIASKIVGEAGLPVQAQPTPDVYPFEQQSNETDWDCLWRLARRVGYEVTCAAGTIHFRPPGAAPGTPVKLEWGKDLRGFHPRATSVAQVSKVTVSGWDPKAKRRVTAGAQTAKLDSNVGLKRVADGELAVSDEIVTSQGEADALAQSTLDCLANAWLEAEGVSRGNPAIRAGATIQVGGVGTRFGGAYLVTKSTHVLRGRTGYETEFEISGRSRRTLIDLLSPDPRTEFAGSLVIGLVTNVDDPEGMDRVRVKFPGLDERHEGWWARVAGMAGDKGGLTVTPKVDDEVVVGFEQDDARRPFVLGCLRSGGAKGGAAAAGPGAADGAAISIGSGDAKIALEPDGSIAIRGAQITVEASAKLELTSTGVVELRGSQIVLG